MRNPILAILTGIFLFILSPLADPARAQSPQAPGRQMMGGMHGGMGGMHGGMTGEKRRPGLERQRSGVRGSPTGLGLMGTLHRWAGLFFSMREELGLAAQQLEQIQAIFFSHIKYAVPKQAERKVMIIEIEEALSGDRIDLHAVEQKVKSLETLNTEMTMEGIRTLQQAFEVLTPEQRPMMRSLLRGSLYARILGIEGRGLPQEAQSGTGLTGSGETEARPEKDIPHHRGQ